MADLSKIKLNGTEYDLKDAVARMLANTQADWNQESQEEVDYIKNKPTALSEFDNDVGFITQGLPDATDMEDGTGLVVMGGKFRPSIGFPFYGELFDKIEWETPITEGYLDTATDGTDTFYKISDISIKQEFLNKDSITPTLYDINNPDLTYSMTQYVYGKGYTAIGMSKKPKQKLLYIVEYPVEGETQDDGTKTSFTSKGIWIRNGTYNYHFVLQSKIVNVPMGEEFLPDSVPKYNKYYEVTQPENYPQSFDDWDQLVADGLAVKLTDNPKSTTFKYYLIKFSDNYLDYNTLLGSKYERTDGGIYSIDSTNIRHNEDGYIVIGTGGYSALGIVSVGKAGTYPSYFLKDDEYYIPSAGVWVLITVVASSGLSANHPKRIFREIKKLDNLFLDEDYLNGLIEAKQTSQIQADWNQTDETAVDYIKNKPNVKDETVFKFILSGDFSVADSDLPVVLDCDTSAQDIVDAYNSGKRLNPDIVNTAFNRERRVFGGYITYNTMTFSTSFMQIQFYSSNISQSLLRYTIVYKDNAWRLTKRQRVLIPIPAYENKNTIQLLASEPNKQDAPQWVEVEDLVEPQMQTDWNQTDDTALDFIKNKPTAISAFTNDAGYLTAHQDISGKANITDLPLIITASCNFTSSLVSGVDTPLEVTNVSKTYADIAEAVSNNRPVKMIVSNGNLKVNLDLTAFDGNIYYFTNSYDPFTGMANGVDNESFNITVRVERVNNIDVFTWIITYNKNAFATKSEVTSQISTAIGNLTEFDTQVVQTLPATGVKGTIYFTPNNHGTNDIYDEFIYVNNAWEKIGNTQVDLSGYVRTNDLALVATSGDYNNLNNTPDIPEKTSDLTNDSGFITLADIPVELPTVSNTDNDKVLTVDNGVWTAKTPAIQFSGDYNDLTNKPTLFDGDYNSLSNKPTLFSGDYDDLTNKPTIPSATVVTQTITSGIKIAEINGTAIYAPAYANGDQIAY